MQIMISTIFGIRNYFEKFFESKTLFKNVYICRGNECSYEYHFNIIFFNQISLFYNLKLPSNEILNTA